jgi:hypothetical protein
MALHRKLISTLAILSFAGGCSTMGSVPPDPGVFFDDFNYDHMAAMSANGWVIRDKTGLPGVEGAKWGPGSVTLTDDPQNPRNRVVRMTAHSDGTAAGTVMAQFCHERKYLEGTYAARVRFSGQPSVGPAGDGVVESFYLISPLKQPLDPQYSELDLEFLPNGGWGDPKTRLYSTSWQTVQLDPWNAYNQHHEDFRSFDGWHILMMQVSDGKIHYLVDGKPFDTHGGRNYPVVPMSINFNLWFIKTGLLPDNHELREYHEDVDWVFHARNRVLSPEQVDAEVKKLRNSGKDHMDTVPAANPPLPSTCDL